MINRIVLDIIHDSVYSEHFFGTTALTNLKVRPVFYSSFTCQKEYEEIVSAELSNDSVLIYCRLFDPGSSETEISISLPSFNRPDEKRLSRTIIYLMNKGYVVKVNDVEKDLNPPAICFNHMYLGLFISRILIEDPSGNLNIVRAAYLQSHLSDVFDILLS